MIYTNEANYVMIQNDKLLYPDSLTSLCPFGLALKLFSGNPSQNLRYASNEWLNTQ